MNLEEKQKVAESLVGESSTAYLAAWTAPSVALLALAFINPWGWSAMKLWASVAIAHLSFFALELCQPWCRDHIDKFIDLEGGVNQAVAKASLRAAAWPLYIPATILYLVVIIRNRHLLPAGKEDEGQD